MIVNRVEQQIIRKSHPLWKTIDKYSLYSKNMYNYANYIIRQEFIKNGKWIRAYELQKMCQSEQCYKDLGSQSAQKVIQALDAHWKSFFKLNKEWELYPNKYLG